MKIHSQIVVLTIFTWACSTPCEKFYDAQQTCKKEAGVDVEDLAEEAKEACSEDDGTNDELYECQADAYRQSDCSTEDGLVRAAASASKCTSGPDTAN